MVDNIQIPQNLTEIFEIKVIRKDKVLRDFLVDLLNRMNKLEKRVAELENGP